MNGITEPTAETQLRFLQNIQRLLDEGQYVASYKFALVLALAELSIERDVAADGTLALPMPELAARFIELYWRQVAPFRGDAVLVQNTGKQAAIIREITAYRTGARTLAEAQRGRSWTKLVTEVRRLLLVMPLWRLQTVGKGKLVFLYEEALVNDAIVLRAGVARCFRALHSIVLALVQLAWVRYLQRVPANHTIMGPGSDLADFLFGVERNALTPLRMPLRELQLGRCFYCSKLLRSGGDVDHFVPWSRYPRDLGHNFVVAHAECNAAKSNLLADIPHLARWHERNQRERRALEQIFEEVRMLRDASTTLHVADWAYESTARAGGLVWMEGSSVRPLDSGWRQALT